MRAETRHIDIRQTFKRPKTGTIVTADHRLSVLFRGSLTTQTITK